MGTQQLCLRWENHQTNQLNGFEHLLSNEFLVDVTLVCESQSLKVHKVVLSACSPFFQSIFLQNPCKHPVVILNGVKYSDLKSVICFMYHGEVNVNQDQLTALLQTAELLEVKGLAELGGGKQTSAGVRSQESPTFDNSHLEEQQFVPNLKQKIVNVANNNNLDSVEIENVKQELNIELEITPSTETNRPLSNTEQEKCFHSTNYSQIQNDSDNSSPFPSLSSPSDISTSKPLQYVLPHQTTAMVIEEPSLNECSFELSRMTEQTQNQKHGSVEFLEHLPQISMVNVSIPSSHLTTASTISSNPESNQSEVFGTFAGSSNDFRYNRRLKPKEKSLAITHYRRRATNRSDDSVNRLRCLHCHKVFSTSSNLKRHMEIHVLERKTYQCSICHKRFSWKTHLSSHLRRDHMYNT